MSKRSRRRTFPAPRPNSASKLSISDRKRLRELNTKRRGELAELAFALKATALDFAVSKPYGDSERYDVIVDARQLTRSSRPRCKPDCPTIQAAHSRKAAHFRKAIAESRAPACPALRALGRVEASYPWCPPHPIPALWRVQVKCSTQLNDGLYHLNAHRRTGGRAVPYLPGEIDFLAAYIIPEDTWYIIPLEAFLGSTSLLFRRRADRKPGQYDEYKEAWHLLRSK